MSRTSKSITNSKFALFYYIASMLVGFVSRKIFIDYVGIEVLGLNQTAQNLLGFLNLSELGIGTAIAFTLYKPLAEDDRRTINEIVTVQGYLYRKIAYIVGGGSILLSIAFPWIFSKSELALWYAYASFGAFLYSSLLTYIVNYRQIVLSASQQNFLITKSYHFPMLIKSIVQIVAIELLPYPYIAWLILHVAFATFASYNLNKTIRREFPYLMIDLGMGKVLLQKYHEIITKVKQLFFHAIGGFVLTQSSSLIIYGYTTLTMVAIYGNYMLIANSVRMLFNSVFQGTTAGVGNLVAEGNKKRILDIFEELFSARFLVITTFLYGFLTMANSFMEIWIGSGRVFTKPTVWVIVGSMYISMSRITVDEFLDAHGLFQDIWAPVAEAALNISLSIVGGAYFGITGVLGGAFVSLFIVIFLWKPFFLFLRGFKLSIFVYIMMYLRHIVPLSITFLVCGMIFHYIKLSETSYMSWGISTILHVVLFAGILYSMLYVTSQGMRDFTKRMHGVVATKFQRR